MARVRVRRRGSVLAVRRTEEERLQIPFYPGGLRPVVHRNALLL